MSSTEQELKTIDQFIKDNDLSVDWHPSYENPNMTDMVKGSVHFKAVIKCDGREFGCYYSCGPGIVEQWAREHKLTAAGHSRTTLDKIVNPKSIDGDREVQAIIKKAREKFRPELADLLDCIASDASGIDNARSFTDWAGDYGYDEDSIKARRIYDTCTDQHHELEQLLGREQIQVLMYEVERL
jgi:hypothetical protein